MSAENNQAMPRKKVLYNKQLKNNYLKLVENQKIEEMTPFNRPEVRKIFNEITNMEFHLTKDLYDFTVDDFFNYLRDSHYSTEKTLNKHLFVFKSYIDYAVRKGECENSNAIDEVIDSDLSPYIKVVQKKPRLMPEMFNQKTKMAFIEEEFTNLNTRESYYKILNKASRYEYLWKKDLHNFTLDEYKELLRVLGYKTISSFNSAKSIFARYLTWATKHKYRANEIDISQQIMKLDPDYYLNMRAVKNRYFKDVEEMDELTDLMVNAQDKATIILSYYGLKGKELSELANLTIDDLDEENNIIKAPNREIKIDKEHMNILIYAYEQEFYEKSNGKYVGRQTNEGRKFDDDSVELLKSSYILKPSDRAEKSKMDYELINGRFCRLMRHLDNYKDDDVTKKYADYTLNSIWKSGIFHSIKKIEDKKFGDIAIKDLQPICEQYSITKARMHAIFGEYKKHFKPIVMEK